MGANGGEWRNSASLLSSVGLSIRHERYNLAEYVGSNPTAVLQPLFCPAAHLIRHHHRFTKPRKGAIKGLTEFVGVKELLIFNYV